MLTPASLRNIDGDAVAAFERAWHTAGNSTLILAGKLDPDLALRHVRFQYGHLASKARGPRAIPPVAPRTATEVVAVHTDQESPAVEVDVAWTAPAGIDETYAARLVLEQVISARLLTLREDLAVSYGMSADYTPRLGPGEWRIAGTVDAARAADAMTALAQVLDQLRTDPEAWKGDFVLARRRAVDARMAAGTSASVIARQLAFVAAFDLPLDFHDRLLDQLAAVRPADLQRIIETELTRERAVIGLFGPAAAVDAAAAAVKRGR